MKKIQTQFKEFMGDAFDVESEVQSGDMNPMAGKFFMKINSLMTMYFRKSGISSMRAETATAQIMQLIEAIAQNGYTPQAGRLLNIYLDKFYGQVK